METAASELSDAPWLPEGILQFGLHMVSHDAASRSVCSLRSSRGGKEDKNRCNQSKSGGHIILHESAACTLLDALLINLGHLLSPHPKLGPRVPLSINFRPSCSKLLGRLINDIRGQERVTQTGSYTCASRQDTTVTSEAEPYSHWKEVIREQVLPGTISRGGADQQG